MHLGQRSGKKGQRKKVDFLKMKCERYLGKWMILAVF